MRPSLRNSPVIGVVASLALALTLFAEPPAETYHGRRVAAKQVLIKLRNPLDETALPAIEKLVDALHVRPLGSGTFRLLESRSKSVDALISLLSRLPVVEFIEPNELVHSTATVPNDPLFGNLWGLSNPSLPGADISATKAWDITTGSTANVVAVIDSGVDYTHPDLTANIWTAPSAFTVTVGGKSLSCPAGSHGYSTITGACDPLDDFGHGSHVSGTIGAVGNNSVGVVGVNWKTRILPVKFLDSTGTGTVADAVDAIDFTIQVKAAFASSATPVNVRVMSASWAGSGFSQALLDAINRAGAQGYPLRRCRR